MCECVSLRSKDPHTKIGSVIVGPNHEIRSTGYNSFPRNINDTNPDRLNRPEKYLWIEHAERNAIYNAARMGTALEGCTLYCVTYPCVECARAIVQAGIAEVIIRADWLDDKLEFAVRWAEMFDRTVQMFKEANITLKEV